MPQFRLPHLACIFVPVLLSLMNYSQMLMWCIVIEVIWSMCTQQDSYGWYMWDSITEYLNGYFNLKCCCNGITAKRVFEGYSQWSMQSTTCDITSDLEMEQSVVVTMLHITSPSVVTSHKSNCAFFLHHKCVFIHLVGLTSHYVMQRGKSPKMQCTHVRC